MAKEELKELIVQEEALLKKLKQQLDDLHGEEHDMVKRVGFTRARNEYLPKKNVLWKEISQHENIRDKAKKDFAKDLSFCIQFNLSYAELCHLEFLGDEFYTKDLDECWDLIKLFKKFQDVIWDSVISGKHGDDSLYVQEDKEIHIKHKDREHYEVIQN